MTNEVGFEKINIEQIGIPKENNYNDSEDEIRILKANIERVGLQNPITVYCDESGKYKTIHGSRRLRALRAIHKKNNELFAEVPCYIVNEPETQVEKNDIVAVNNFYTRERNRDVSLKEFICIYDGCKKCIEGQSYKNAMSEIELLISEDNRNSKKYKQYKEACDSVICEFKEAYLDGNITFDVFMQLRYLNYTQQISFYGLRCETLLEVTLDDIDEFLAEWRSDTQKELCEDDVLLDETNGPKYIPIDYVSATIDDLDDDIEDDKEEVITVIDVKEDDDEDLMLYVESGDTANVSSDLSDNEEYVVNVIDIKPEEQEIEESKIESTENIKKIPSVKNDALVAIRRSFFDKAVKTSDFFNAAVSLYMNGKSREVEFSLRQETKKQLDSAISALRSVIEKICDKEDLEEAKQVTGTSFFDL